MRCFGRSTGEPKGLITDTQTLIGDSRNFLTTFNEWDKSRGLGDQPIILYGYSLGACYSVATYRYLHRLPELKKRITAKVVTSPQYGMGPLWYPTWYRPRKGYWLSKINENWGNFQPLVSMRDRNDPYAYKGPTYSRTIWNVQDWTNENLKEAHLIDLPYHQT